MSFEIFSRFLGHLMTAEEFNKYRTHSHIGVVCALYCAMLTISFSLVFDKEQTPLFLLFLSRTWFRI